MAKTPNAPRNFAVMRVGRKGLETTRTPAPASISVAGRNVAIIVQDTLPPSVPTGLTATAVSSGTINLSWNASTDTGGSGLAGYRVYRDGNGTPLIDTASTSYSNTGLSASTLYSYRVSAYDVQGNESAQSSAATATTQASGGGGFVLTHNTNVVISGSGFGTKSAPIRVADFGTAADNTLDSQWSNGQPNAASNSYANLKNRSFNGSGIFANTLSGSNIARPHAFAAKVLAGCHLDLNNGNGGNNVMPWIDFTKVNGSYLTGSYYVRNDPAWPDGDAADANYKKLNYGSNGDPYLAPNWYCTGFGGAKSDQTWAYNDDMGLNGGSASLINPDINGHSNYYWELGMGDFWAGWIRVSFNIKISNANDGFIRIWEGNRLVLDYLGPTDKYPGTSRSLGIEGYNRTRGTVQWRYIVDACMDYSPSPGRWFATNSATFFSSTIIEQFPHYDVATGSAQPLTPKQGHLSSGVPIFLHYRDEVLGNQVITGYSFG